MFRKYLILCAIFIASCSKETETIATDCNLGDNRFALSDGKVTDWHVRTNKGLLNEGQGQFKGCFRSFGGLRLLQDDDQYYHPLFRLGDTALSYMGLQYIIEFDSLDSLVARHTELENYTILRLSP